MIPILPGVATQVVPPGVVKSPGGLLAIALICNTISTPHQIILQNLLIQLLNEWQLSFRLCLYVLPIRGDRPVSVGFRRKL